MFLLRQITIKFSSWFPSSSAYTDANVLSLRWGCCSVTVEWRYVPSVVALAHATYAEILTYLTCNTILHLVRAWLESICGATGVQSTASACWCSAVQAKRIIAIRAWFVYDSRSSWPRSSRFQKHSSIRRKKHVNRTFSYVHKSVQTPRTARIISLNCSVRRLRDRQHCLVAMQQPFSNPTRGCTQSSVSYQWGRGGG